MRKSKSHARPVKTIIINISNRFDFSRDAVSCLRLLFANKFLPGQQEAARLEEAEGPENLQAPGRRCGQAAFPLLLPAICGMVWQIAGPWK